MSNNEATKYAYFFGVIWTLYFLYYWLILSDFPTTPGVKRYQLIKLWWMKRKRKPRWVCSFHSAYLKKGAPAGLNATKCEFCKAGFKKRGFTK